MGDENPIRTLGDYSKPSHEGYRNTIELLVGNNVVPPIDTIGWEESALRLFQSSLRDQAAIGLTPSSRSSPHGRDFAKSVKAIALPQDIPSTSDRCLIELENQVQRLMEAHLAPTQPTQVNKITTSCEIYSGPHDTQYCMENPEQAFVDYPSSRTDEAGGVTSPESTIQTLLSFEKYTPPVTYPEEVEKTLRTPIEVEPLNETKLEEVGLNCNHNTPLSSREVPSFDKPKPQPQPLPNFPPLDASLGTKRGLKLPIKPQSPDSFRIKVVEPLTIHTLPSPHVTSFHHKDTYCYYHPCIGDPKKHYGFKPGLLGQGGSLGVDLSNWEMIEDDRRLEPKENSFLGRRLNLPVRPKELENVIFDEKKLGSS
ncbi:hypothetical protein Tco_0344953 [Tanacetum coccineum]